MGYYTFHQLDFRPLEEVSIPQCEHANPGEATFCMTCGKQIRQTSIVDIVWDYIATAPEMETLLYAVGEDGTGEDRCKWYNHQDDMKVISEKFPGVLFTLSGEGEENYDMWKEYWLGGKVQEDQAKITFDGFDVTRLMEPKSRA